MSRIHVYFNIFEFIYKVSNFPDPLAHARESCAGASAMLCSPLCREVDQTPATACAKILDLYIGGKQESLGFCVPQVRKMLVYIPILSEKYLDLARRRRENFEVIPL